jgi:hypothetical protein
MAMYWALVQLRNVSLSARSPPNDGLGTILLDRSKSVHEDGAGAIRAQCH